MSVGWFLDFNIFNKQQQQQQQQQQQLPNNLY